jgi:hypothetical protein
MRTIGLFLTLSLSLLAARAVAEEACGVPTCDPANCGSADRCARCGSECGGCQQRTCQLICGTEKVKKYCWEVKCEEFCPLLPGRLCDDCNECNGSSTEPCQHCKECKGGEKCPNPIIRTPHTANARVKKTLVKKEYECERPKYKTVVQYLCPSCAAGSGTTAPTPPEDSKPAAPAPAPAQPEAPQPKSTFTMPFPPVIRTAFAGK